MALNRPDNDMFGRVYYNNILKRTRGPRWTTFGAPIAIIRRKMQFEVCCYTYAYIHAIRVVYISGVLLGILYTYVYVRKRNPCPVKIIRVGSYKIIINFGVTVRPL